MRVLGDKLAGSFSEQDQLPSGCFSAPIARELVHRRAIAEVFLTGIHSPGNRTFTIWAQWPRWHVFYGSQRDCFDSALVVETLRQLTVLVAHTQLGVPLDMQFLMPEMSVSMTPGATQDPLHPADVTAEVHVSEVRRTGQGISAFRTTAVFFVNGHKIAEGTARARIVDPEAYNRIRSRHRITEGHQEVPPVSADRVGHTSAWNVVLGESDASGWWPLRVDISNPILFDHPLDHVPGVLLIEAVRQALRLAVKDPGLDFATLEAQFTSIAEFTDEAKVVLEALTNGAESTTAVASIQANGKVLMRAVTGTTPMKPPLRRADQHFQWKPARTVPAGPRENLHP
ncbi:ScbA/BarX family gamma-butyrolactone biosynthesis protein (plasmid) [Pseudarthrobacter sp. O4]|uniref:ScbA/BarX family gamma-butyrolactone biosynthesis protein n=1 Tax=Pseudarthrobacter sp. O4 TaxID=3418417 RepID=UPI003CE80881